MTDACISREQLLRTTDILSPWDSVLIGDCVGCAYNGKRHQKCSCCRRNQYMKDNYKEVDNG